MTPDDAILEVFSDLAPEYEETMDCELEQYLGIGYEEFVEGLLKWAAVEPDDWVLDVATGTALIPRRLAASRGEKGRTVGLDITPAMLQRGRTALDAGNLSASIFLVRGSGMELPFAPAVFDVIICAFGTHHMHPPRMLQEMRRVLCAGGRLVVAEAGAPLYLRTLWGRFLLKILLLAFGLTKPKARAQIEEDAFSHMYTPEEWHTMLSDAGFGEIQVRPSRMHRIWYPRALIMCAIVEEC